MPDQRWLLNHYNLDSVEPEEQEKLKEVIKTELRSALDRKAIQVKPQRSLSSSEREKVKKVYLNDQEIVFLYHLLKR